MFGLESHSNLDPTDIRDPSIHPNKDPTEILQKVPSVAWSSQKLDVCRIITQVPYQGFLTHDNNQTTD